MKSPGFYPVQPLKKSILGIRCLFSPSHAGIIPPSGLLNKSIEAAGFTPKLCTDLDLHSCQTLENNKEKLKNDLVHPFLSEAVIKQRNIKDYTTDEILKDAGIEKGEFALVYGGPPCQSFSVFGLRKGMEDPRGTLLWDY
jgi:DNA (cytosine-5)-methyltransferase 1